MNLADSAYIEQCLGEMKDRKSKNAFLESIMNNPSVTVLHEEKGHKTVLFPENKGPKTSTWKQTKQMAFDLNKAGYDVAFIPESDSEKGADAIIKLSHNDYKIVDFKYSTTKLANTLQKDLIGGFSQANTIVLRTTNMDAGLLSEVLAYLGRNERNKGFRFGEIYFLNKYGGILHIDRSNIRRNNYKKKLKGFL